MFDTNNRNARVIDGTGAPEFEADIGISGATIVAVNPSVIRLRHNPQTVG